MEASSVPGPDPSALTTLHVRRARDGDAESLAWLVARLTPLLLAQARHHLSGALRALYDPEDLVQEVWLVMLPKLAELPHREGRYTPVLLKFLAGVLANKVGNLLQKHVLKKPRAVSSDAGDSGAGVLAALPTPVTGAMTRLLRGEERDQVREALECLAPQDREILILRGIEQASYREIAAVLGVDPDVLPMRYQRALARLRKELPGSVYEELVEE
jgi:RNA polymerase sigma-70 factor (ECF subfamily)